MKLLNIVHYLLNITMVWVALAIAVNVMFGLIHFIILIVNGEFHMGLVKWLILLSGIPGVLLGVRITMAEMNHD